MSADRIRADRLSRLFCNVVEDIITARALQQTTDGEVSRAQYAGLQFVYLHPACCIKDLANGLAVSHPAAVKLVERLEAKGLIARSPHQRDRRVVQLAATRGGIRQVEAVMVARSENIESVLERAGDGCRCDILGCLEAFIKAALSDEKDVGGVCLRCGGMHDDGCPVCETEYELTGHLRSDA
jgi:MarR family transcriptional regulator, negative regulator of the multidrug operon emrRAB